MPHENGSNLLEFVAAAKSKGAADEFLASFLTRRGWPQDDVYSALGRYWERETGIAVPDRSRRGEASRDAFLYLLSFSTLATWTSALGSMVFQFINRWLPDPVSRDQWENMRIAVTWQMASIAVAFPIFMLVTRTILREARDHSERLESGVRKWLTYIALLLTAGAIICDLIWFLDYFLTGELTSRFVSKAFTVIVICAAIFIYYLGSLNWNRDTDVSLVRSRSLKFGIAAAAVVAAAFLTGLGVAGTPAVQRRVQADNRRIQDLRAIASAAHFRRQRAGMSGEPVPATLSEFAGKGISRSALSDPETGTPYEYHVRSGTTYELCAVFSAPTETGGISGTHYWYHDKGRACFTLDASSEPAWY